MAHSAEGPSGQSLAEWYDAPVGRLVGEEIRSRYRAHTAEAFGYHALVLGAAGAPMALDEAVRIGHCVVADRQEGMAVRLRPDALPFEAESLDLVTLAHALEGEEPPIAILREVDRCLRPEGKLVVIGFNPISLFSLARVVRRPCNRALRAGHRNAPWRIVEWLHVLGYEIEAVERLAAAPPVCRPGTWRRLAGMRRFVNRFLPLLGGVYLITATRRVSNAHIVRPAFRWRDLLPRGVPVGTQSGARRGQHDRIVPTNRSRLD
ncbi:MAG: class I SAM-dependent methyltransferase [Halothiobacillaceae bacterium]